MTNASHNQNIIECCAHRVPGMEAGRVKGDGGGRVNGEGRGRAPFPPFREEGYGWDYRVWALTVLLNVGTVIHTHTWKNIHTC